MKEIHYPGHQQALVKNGIVTEVLSFSDHSNEEFSKILELFDFDLVIDLCNINQDAAIGAYWNGSTFEHKPFPSWKLDSNGKWQPPIAMPNGTYYWDEDSQNWIGYLPNPCPIECN